MKLLLDENLSFRLVSSLALGYPESTHLLGKHRSRISRFEADTEESLIVLR